MDIPKLFMLKCGRGNSKLSLSNNLTFTSRGDLYISSEKNGSFYTLSGDSIIKRGIDNNITYLGNDILYFNMLKVNDGYQIYTISPDGDRVYLSKRMNKLSLSKDLFTFIIDEVKFPESGVKSLDFDKPFLRVKNNKYYFWILSFFIFFLCVLFILYL